MWKKQFLNFLNLLDIFYFTKNSIIDQIPEICFILIKELSKEKLENSELKNNMFFNFLTENETRQQLPSDCIKKLKIELRELEISNNFENIKKLVFNENNFDIIKKNSFKNIEDWNLETDEHFRKLKLVVKILKKVENREEEKKNIYKNFDELEKKLIEYKNEFLEEIYFKIIEKTKNKILVGKFNKENIDNLYKKLNKVISIKKIKELTKKDKKICIQHLLDLVDIFMNCEEDVYKNNFVLYLKNFRSLAECYKLEYIDNDEFFLLLNRRIKNIKYYEVEFSLSSRIDKHLITFINLIID